MAHFRATVRGKGKEVSRLGEVPLGITAKVNGWKVGVKVVGVVNGAGHDVFSIEATYGSNGSGLGTIVGYVMLDESGVPQFITSS